MKLVDLFVIAARPGDGGEWTMLLWIEEGWRSWWVQ